MSEFYDEKLNNQSSRFSRYKSCKILVDKSTGESLISTRRIPKIAKSLDDTFHVIKSNEVGRLDKIAYDYYKSPQLWWVLAEINEIKDPFKDMQVGGILRVPKFETLYINNIGLF